MKHQRNCEPHTQPDDRAMTRSACSSFVKVLTRSACLSFVKALGFASTDDLLFLVLPTFLRAVVCLKKGLAVLGVFGTSLSTDSVSRTCLGASKYSRDCPLFLIPLLGPPATRTRCISPYLSYVGSAFTRTHDGTSKALCYTLAWYMRMIGAPGSVG